MSWSHLASSKGVGLIKTSLRLLILRSHRHHKNATTIIWEKPRTGRIKLNFDGSSKWGGNHDASIGGVCRDHQGLFMLGYAERIGRATSSVAELAACKRGLELALENGWLSICIEGDAKLVDLLVNHAKLKSTEDAFAKLGYQYQNPQIWRDDPPTEVAPLLQHDVEAKVNWQKK